MSDWRILPDADAVRDAAVAQIERSAATAIAARGIFRIALAGGSTPRAIYQRLAENPSRLARWQLYYGDERCLPNDHPERNSRMVSDCGLASCAGGHYPIPAEKGAETAALAYAVRLAAVLPFDLVMLGVGEDGHTASLFPGHKWRDDVLATAVHHAPKPPPDRVSLTPRALSSSRQMLVVATGAAKSEALHRWRAGEPLPIQRVTSSHPDCLVLSDVPLTHDDTR